jgi:hypothetical protein
MSWSASSRSGALGSYLSLFGSVGTLLCCALPSLLALLGLGATVAAVLSAVPWLVALSRNKTWVFAVSGILIAANFLYVYRLAPALRARTASCEPGERDACAGASVASRAVLWLSAATYLTGFFVAFVLGPILTRSSE